MVETAKNRAIMGRGNSHEATRFGGLGSGVDLWGCLGRVSYLLIPPCASEGSGRSCLHPERKALLAGGVTW